MESELRRIRMVVALTVVLSLGAVLVVPSSVLMGATGVVGDEGRPLTEADFAAIPGPVIDDAVRLAGELYGDYREEDSDFVRQLLTMYLEAQDKDFIMVFNAGGWGSKSMEVSHDMRSIFDGINYDLDAAGYSTLFVDYLRTTDETVRGHLDEMMSMLSLYPSKARDLALRVQFLTDHLPGTRVIVTGESTGAIICDRVMDILEGNPRVYSIQTGPPFWYRNKALERTLVLKDNGMVPDSFSQGDFFTIISATLESALGVVTPEGQSGKVLYYLGAPGHEYLWEYPGVYSRILDFIYQNFEIN